MENTIIVLSLILPGKRQSMLLKDIHNFTLNLRLSHSARNEDLESCFLKMGLFIDYYTAVLLKMFKKFGQS